MNSLPTETHLSPIYLNLYDLGGWNNNITHAFGLTFYHCAIETHSTEYGYMGHSYGFTGVYKTSKYDRRFHLYRFRQTIEIGWTQFNEKDIDDIVNDLQRFYLGLDYETTKKNSIHFAQYLLERLNYNLQPNTLIPTYVNRIRRLCQTFSFLKNFDTEKDIAEVNILYSLYMKYQGNLQRICQLLQIDTFDKLQRIIKLIEQGIQQRKLPIFILYTRYNPSRNDDYLWKKSPNDIPLTLTEIFHQFDTITLRGRTSIDKHLDNSTQTTLVSHIPYSSQLQSISQNQGQISLTSPLTSYISNQAIPQQTTSLRLHEISNPIKKKTRRKLPRDLEFNPTLYQFKSNKNYTNNALSIKAIFNDETDSIV